MIGPCPENRPWKVLGWKSQSIELWAQYKYGTFGPRMDMCIGIKLFCSPSNGVLWPTFAGRVNAMVDSNSQPQKSDIHSGRGKVLF